MVTQKPWVISRSFTSKVVIWLVVEPPLWKIWKSLGMMIPKNSSKPPASHSLQLLNFSSGTLATSWPSRRSAEAWMASCSAGSASQLLLGNGGFPWPGGTPKWMVYKGNSHWNRWFGSTSILGNHQTPPNDLGTFGEKSKGSNDKWKRWSSEQIWI